MPRKNIIFATSLNLLIYKHTNMRKLLFLLPILAITFASCDSNSTKPNSYSVDATITGISGSDVVMLIEDPTNPQGFRVDSLKATADQVSFSGIIDTVRVAMITVDDPKHMKMTSEGPIPPMPTQFFVEPGAEIKISGDVNTMHLSTIGGSPMNNQMNALVRFVGKQQVLVDSLVDILRQGQLEGVQLDQMRDNIRAEYMNLVDLYAEFVRNNDDADLSPFIIKMYIAQFHEMGKVKPLYDLLTERVKATTYGKMLANDFYESSETTIGNQAPDFELIDSNNEIIKLSDFSGRYLVIDFWGSWCKPCRISHPKLVQTVEKYKSKGLQMLGIAADKENDEWLQAIKDDKLTWQHVNAYTQPGTDVLSLYSIKAFPTKVIISPEGEIVAQYVGDDPAFYTFLETIYE